MSRWKVRPPDADVLLLWDGDYRILQRCANGFRSGDKNYSMEGLARCAERCGWRFMALELPLPPDTGPHSAPGERR